ncbi:MAG TPA: hypothetical protein ENI85_17605 [Deltaproteobacteria bacterium]|nr:hypothetical protein [Deltaproteobacteria bacterium]
MDRSDIGTSLPGHPLFRVGVFTLSYLLFATGYALDRGNTEFLFYCGVMVLLIVATALAHRHFSFSRGLLWALSIWGALHMAGGLVTIPDDWPAAGEFRVLYSWWILPGRDVDGQPGGWLKYDQVVHAYGFGISTWLCWQILRGALESRMACTGRNQRIEPTAALMFLVAAAGMGLGALNEVVEFIATRITVTNVGGYENTGWDLVANLVGATTAALILYRTERSPSRTNRTGEVAPAAHGPSRR